MFKNKKTRTNTPFLLLAIIFISFALRAPITSIGPLAGFIHDDLGVTNGFVGFITTLPLLAFAICSPFVSKVSSRYGIGRVVLAGLVLIILGGMIRSYMGILGLIFGTALIGVGIAIGNVMIPSIVKLKFPNNIGIGTSTFVTCMAIFASIGAGVSYPLAVDLGLGWKTALVVWPGVAIIALIIWLPQIGLSADSGCSNTWRVPCVTTTKIRKKSIWKSKLAWYITMYMGLQSLLYYSITAWLPSILIGNGMTPEMAGYMALGFQLIGIPASFAIPIIASKAKSQRTIVIGTCLAYFVGMGTIMIGGSLLVDIISIIFISIGASASFSWIMVMVGIRASDAEEAADLSGMSQAIGYFLAAIGPTLCGVVYDLTNKWTYPMSFLLFITVLLTIFGILVAKKEKLFN